MQRIRRTGAFPSSCSTTATQTKRNLHRGIRKNRERGNRQRQARRRIRKTRVRTTRSKKKRLALEVSPEDCFRDANVTSCFLSGYAYATTRCNSVSRDCTAELAPREWELSGQQHTRTYLPGLPAAVTP